MRAGVLISAVSHVVLVALALLGTPKLFDNVPLQAIEVDLVRPPEVEPPKEPEKEPEDKPAPWNPLPEAGASQPKTPPSPPETPQTQRKQPEPAPQQQALATPRAGVASQPEPQSQPWIFEPGNIPALMGMPAGSQPGFDSESSTAANLTADEKTAIRAHLKKCWKLPPGMSAAQSTRVVVRIFLRQNGALAGEPMLIEASASRDGPALLEAAIRSVKECQPFAFLPPDKYREWKVLDLNFSPRTMAGG
jgi:outer membrane biosynthesis protein TonB